MHIVHSREVPHISHVHVIQCLSLSSLVLTYLTKSLDKTDRFTMQWLSGKKIYHSVQLLIKCWTDKNSSDKLTFKCKVQLVIK